MRTLQNEYISFERIRLNNLQNTPVDRGEVAVFDNDKYTELLARLSSLEQEAIRRTKLPHLYAYPWYKWAYDFFTSTNKMNILCAANQISKSSTQIRKCIEWATNKELWPKLWPNRTPRQFWYLYPTKDVATAEYHTKWKPEFLPVAEEDDPVYGWKPEFDNKKLKAIWFKSGIVVYFKTYETDVQALQTGSVDALFLDEELPADLFDELQFRLSATEGYFHAVFTATLGQPFWYEAVECIGQENERFPEAFKQQISKYDCITYMDGSPSPWTVERIQSEEKNCRSDASRLRRIYGRFIKSENIAVPEYVASLHVTHNPSGPPGTVPAGWSLYASVDIGSATGSGHPAAILFLAVSPDRIKARVVYTWRGDKIPTTCGDILQRYLEMEEELTKQAPLSARVYDQSSSEFFLISQSKNIFFDKSDKDRKSGFLLMNTLFKYNVLEIDKDCTDNGKLSTELQTVAEDSGEEVLDDLLACLRYACKKVPFDFLKILGKPLPTNQKGERVERPIITPEQLQQKHRQQRYEQEMRERRGEYEPSDLLRDPLEDELDHWQELL